MPGAPGCIEVYPHPAMVALFSLPYTLPYKGKKGRDLASLQTAYEVLLDSMEHHLPELELTRSERWAQLRTIAASPQRKADLERIEDEIDAIVCAHLAWLWSNRPRRAARLRRRSHRLHRRPAAACAPAYGAPCEPCAHAGPDRHAACCRGRGQTLGAHSRHGWEPFPDQAVEVMTGRRIEMSGSGHDAAQSRSTGHDELVDAKSPLEQREECVDKAEHAANGNVLDAGLVQDRLHDLHLPAHALHQVALHAAANEQLVPPRREESTNSTHPDLGVLIALGIDHVDPGGADGDVVDVGPASGDPPVVESQHPAAVGLLKDSTDTFLTDCPALPCTGGLGFADERRNRPDQCAAILQPGLATSGPAFVLTTNAATRRAGDWTDVGSLSGPDGIAQPWFAGGQASETHNSAFRSHIARTLAVAHGCSTRTPSGIPQPDHLRQRARCLLRPHGFGQ